MNRKWIILNLALIGVIAYAGVQLRNQWRAAKARESAKLNRPVKQSAPPSYPAALPEPPVLASGYAPIAQKMLFDKSRNPDVPIEVPVAPPKPPMPPLPAYHGMMAIGSGGPTAFFSVNKDAPHKAVHPGEQIGAFKLVGVNDEEVVLEWNGEIIHKRADELFSAAAAPAEAAPAADRTAAPAAAAAAPPAPVKTGPGEVTQFGGSRVCTVNDGHADGAVVDGYKKVMHQTPWGTSCTYDPVGK